MRGGSGGRPFYPTIIARPCDPNSTRKAPTGVGSPSLKGRGVHRELAELQKNARGHVEFTRSCVREIHSLKALKPVLEERREDRVLSLLEDWPAHLRY